MKKKIVKKKKQITIDLKDLAPVHYKMIVDQAIEECEKALKKAEKKVSPGVRWLVSARITNYLWCRVNGPVLEFKEVIKMFDKGLQNR